MQLCFNHVTTDVFFQFKFLVFFNSSMLTSCTTIYVILIHSAPKASAGREWRLFLGHSGLIDTHKD